MPAVIAAITIQQIIQAFVVSAILGLVSKEFFTPKSQNSSLENEARQRQVMIRSSTEPHRVIIGQALVSGPLAYIETSGTGQEYVNVVILLAAHQCQEIGDIYFDDQLVGDLDGSGNVTTGTFAGLARIKKHLGTDTQAADSDLVAESAGKWTTAHQLCGITYIYVRLLRDDTAYPNGVPLIRALVKGKLFEDPRVSGSPNNPTWSPNWALAMRDYYKSDTGLRCDLSELGDLAFIAAANTSDERVIVTYASPAFTIDGGSPTPNTITFADDENRLQTGDVVIPSTTGSLAGTGITAGAPIWFIRINATEGKFANSYANAVAGTAVALGGPGSGVHTLTPAPRVLPANATDKLAFESPERFISLGDGVQIASTGTLPTGLAALTTYYGIKTRDFEMQLASTYANALAGVPVPFSSDGTGTITLTHIDQARYTVNGSYTLGETPSAIISNMLAASGGVQTYSQGVFSIFAGAYTSPTITITEDDLRGPITGTTGPDAKDLFNAVQGTYVDQWKYWQPSDFPPVTNATYQAQDGGEQFFSDIDLALVTDVVRAQRMGKMVLERARRGETITLPCKLTKFDADVWDTAQVTIAAMGYNGDVFRITGWNFAWDENGPGVDLTLTKEDAAIYSWSSADAVHNAVAPALDIAPPTTVQPPLGLGSPAVLSLIAERVTSFPVADPSTTVVISVDWIAAPEPNGYLYEVQWRKSTDTTWQSILLPFSGDSAYRIKETDVSSSYDARVRTVSKMGAKSSWLTGNIAFATSQVAVNTSDLASDAAAVVTHAFSTSILTSSPSTSVGLQLCIINSSGGSVLVTISARVQRASVSYGTGSVEYTIQRLDGPLTGSPDAVLGLSRVVTAAFPATQRPGSPSVFDFDKVSTIAIHDDPPTGQVTYAVMAQFKDSVGNGDSASFSYREMTVEETKR